MHLPPICADPPMKTRFSALVSRIQALDFPAVVGITGRVAVGKTTFSKTIVDELRRLRMSATVLGTDGYIFPTATLETNNLMAVKGRFRTHDLPAVIADIQAWRTGEPVRVPVYDHQLYDRRPDKLVVEPGNVLVVEGLLAAHPELAPHLDFRVFLETTDPSFVHGWYVARALRYFPGQHARIQAAWVEINERTYTEETIHARHDAHAVVVFDRNHAICEIEHHSADCASPSA